MTAADDGAPAPALNLTAEPSPTRGDGKVTATQLKAWGEMYGVDHRQLRRWIKRGRERNDPCPLDDPPRMPQWIETHLDKIRAALLEKVGAAAELAAAQKPSSTPAAASPPVTSDPASLAPGDTLPPASNVTGDPNAAGNAAVGAKGLTVPSIDLTKVGGIEGQLCDFQSKVVAAVQQQLIDAYKAGQPARISSLQKQLNDAGEQMRKYERAAEEKAKRVGDYLLKTEVFSEVMTALTTLGTMREQRKKRMRTDLATLGTHPIIAEALAGAGVDQETAARVLLLLVNLEPTILARLDESIDRTGKSEESVLRNLAQMKAPADVLLALAA